MSARFSAFASSRLCRVVSVSALVLVLGAGAARADVVGRLKFTVLNAADEKPVAGARVTLKDSAGVRPDVSLTTGADGTILSPPLENRTWRVTVEASEFTADAREVAVAADVTTDVEVLLEPAKERVIRITEAASLVRRNDTSSGTRRDQNFLNHFPTTGANTQSLSKVLRAVPGFAEDSVNQAHPRNEHSATAIYLNGFLLPGVLQGRAGQFLNPEAIQTLDVQTGGYAPEYGGETAAVLNLSLRSGPVAPFVDGRLGGGEFGTFEGVLTAGGQRGRLIGETGGRRFRYFLNFSQRNTNNAVEPPQPDNQSAHNRQDSTTIFGNFNYIPDARSEWTLTLNATPARTDIANRTGLSAEYAGLGQGFGYGGASDRGTFTTDFFGNAVPLVNQDEARQDIYQRDQNGFGILQYRRQFGESVSGLFSVGYTRSKLDILNNNPGVNLNQLPTDASIEFNPTIRREYDQTQLQANFTVSRGAHTLKFGGLYTDQSGNESYQFTPASQTALFALAETDERLAPNLLARDSDGNLVRVPTGGEEEQGEDNIDISEDRSRARTTSRRPLAQRRTRQEGEEEETSLVYDPTMTPNASAPTLNVDRSGYYAAFYAQDTWRATGAVTLNYGLRLDSYRATQSLGQDTVNQTEVSPRINVAYAFLPGTVARASYNRLFSQPPLAQGQIVGQSIVPQLAHMVEVSVERQLTRRSTVKAAFYNKEFDQQLDTALLISGTQIGAYATVNLEKSFAHGFELSYDLQPRSNTGLGAYFTWANSINKPTGSKSTGEELEQYADHDQLNTITGGLSYALANGASAGLNVYYGSGIFSSPLVEGGPREDRTEVNFSLSSGPRVFSGVTANLAVENLFDSRARINFQSPFSGTRFQQGRRVLLSIGGRF